MSFDLNIERQHQRQIVRNKYTSRNFNSELYLMFEEYREEFSRHKKSLNYEPQLVRKDIFDKYYDLFDTYYDLRCRCNEKQTTKKSSKKRGKPIIFPKLRNNNIRSKTFIIKYEKQLFPAIVLLLNSFNCKYFYFAIDDILDFLQSDPIEKNNILSVVYLPALFLHNNFSISFFHMWIKGIDIETVIKPNKFLFKDFKIINYIHISFMYKIAKPIKKRKSIW